MEQVRQFRYLGSVISEDGYCTKEIRSRIKMAKKVFMEKKLFTVKMNLKKRIMKCLVWSVALYAAETWIRDAIAALRVLYERTWNTTIKSMSATLTMKKVLIV